MNELISIFIPTYNRSEELSKILYKTIRSISKYNIGIYIYDNASTDSTSTVVRKASETYAPIFYHRNEINMGIDANMLNCLEGIDTKYILMLGDDDYIVEDFYERLEEYLNQSFDFIVLSQNMSLQTKEFVNIQESFIFLWDKMPYGTLIIRGKRVDKDLMNKYIGTSHAYSAIPWEIMSNPAVSDKKCLFYSQSKLVELGTIKKTWASNAIDIYFYQIPLWFSLLPGKVHAENIRKKYMSNLFSLRSLLTLAMQYDFSKLTNDTWLTVSQKCKYNVINKLFRWKAR